MRKYNIFKDHNENIVLETFNEDYSYHELIIINDFIINIESSKDKLFFYNKNGEKIYALFDNEEERKNALKEIILLMKKSVKIEND